MKLLIIAFCLASSLTVPAFAKSSSHITATISHSGGTDSNGCHYNRKTGVYHCH